MNRRTDNCTKSDKKKFFTKLMFGAVRRNRFHPFWASVTVLNVRRRITHMLIKLDSALLGEGRRTKVNR